ncbi:exodeoxyribonuclease III [Glaciecola punicea ACAM 611]|jgi:exodeoxyribonuclease-3|uniref:Exodeoxyribonuclease III n=1 Tax=Glaciecola punicea ACAM 611 TaxID=1121923 RepID=H5TE04_9ALTE|nr:exodeoxyribonuclease III [Glaciecola punicea]OFA31076.1 exodeoxyribonuclease III [Glaciecola punicea]GAB56531.1 exodeoxyribonuclease III [Glaciecola punicea ACAM 611]
MKLVSWNVNGIRAAVKKDFLQSLAAMDCDVLCLQETKAQDEQVIEALCDLHGYHIFTNSAVKKGYSGTSVITRVEPIDVTKDIGISEHDQEGRVLCAEFSDFYLVTVYTPNSGSELKRLGYRGQWDADFLTYIKALEAKKPVVICGDLNAAHKDLDLARPKPNYNKSAGYTQQEIDGIDNLIAAGFIDSFRHVHPDTVKYSWWSYRAGARERNVGWRIDYFLVSSALAANISDAEIYDDIHGSDHCPVSVKLAFK